MVKIMLDEVMQWIIRCNRKQIIYRAAFNNLICIDFVLEQAVSDVCSKFEKTATYVFWPFFPEN